MKRLLLGMLGFFVIFALPAAEPEIRCEGE